MRIQIVSKTKENYKQKKIGRWYHIPEELEKRGNIIKYNTRKDWWKWYVDYLRFKPDVVISTGLVAGIVGFYKQIGLMRKPLVLDWNDSYAEISGAHRGIARTAFLEYNAVSAADAIISPSMYRLSLAKSFGKKGFYVPHGVGKISDKKAELPGKYKIIYVGEQSKHKRVDLLIEAARKVDCDVYLVGNVNEEFKEIAPENCHFPGRIEPEKIFEYINSADVCVITDDNDSTLKMFEYAKAGKAILSFQNRTAYFLKHLENAYLTNDLSEGIRKLRNKTLRKRLEQNIKKVKILSWEQVAKEYESTLKRVIFDKL
jgi:glycosyltransferase involved in cell wall biosynthesis